MKSIRAALVILASLLCLSLFYGCGDDDEITNDISNVPAELVGTWHWVSATMNGVPQIFPNISMTDSSDAMEITFSSANIWFSTEYYNSVVVFTQGGTFTVNDQTLIITQTTEKGLEINPYEVFTADWEVLGGNLILTQEEIIGSDTLVLISTFNK